jgi:alpha-tubulin suppressor-like RCC1 family protein
LGISRAVGSDGQTGHGNLYHMKTPQVIEDLRSITVMKIACGPCYSLVVSDSGDMYVWGNCDGKWLPQSYFVITIASMNISVCRWLARVLPEAWTTICRC